MTQNNWTKCELGDVVSLEQEKISCTFAKETSYVSTENMLPNKGGVSIISSLPAKGSVSVYKKDDVLISNIRPYFKKIWQAKNDGTCSGDVLVFRAKKVEPRFLYFVLSDESFFDYVMLGSKGTKMPRGDKQQIMKYPLPNLPPLEEQKRIAGVLGAFDDKIELLQKQNKTLEDMAKAIFKSWFVDFDIVKAKQRGEDKQKILSTYKITEELYNLFPSSFTDAPASSSLGPIPTGWEVKQIKDIACFSNGYAFKSSELFDAPQGYPVVKMGNIIKGGGVDLSIFKSYYNGPLTNRIFCAKKGDILMCMTDMKSSMNLLGYSGLIYESDRYLVNQRVGILHAYNENELSTFYLYIYINQNTTINELRAKANSGVQVNLSSQGIKETDILTPNEKINIHFTMAVENIYEKIFTNNKQIQTLTELRDGLLPRLLSGKLKV